MRFVFEPYQLQRIVKRVDSEFSIVACFYDLNPIYLNRQLTSPLCCMPMEHRTDLAIIWSFILNKASELLTAARACGH